MKKLLSLTLKSLLAIALSLLLVACMGESSTIQGTDIVINGLTLDGKIISGVVSNSTTEFSFRDNVDVAEEATYVVARDVYGESPILSKIVPLEPGDNVFYILVTNGNEYECFTVNIRRKPTYTVSFDTPYGVKPEDQTIEEGFLAQEPSITPIPGMTFSGWDFDFSTPIMSDKHITAGWHANTDTKYTVEYYLESLDKSDYELIDTVELSGTTDSTAEASIKTFEHFTYNSARSTISGNIEGDESLVLKVYYTRDSYTINTTASDPMGGSVTFGGTYPYGTELTLTSTINAGYTFFGYFVADDKVCENISYTFTVSESLTIMASIEANSSTKYTVEYYFESLDKSDYELIDTVELSGTTDSTVTAEQKLFDHFSIKSSISTLSGNINGDGSLVLKVYYTRDTYSIKAERNNTKGGSINGGATYSYESTVTLSATTNTGYTFLGWYDGNTKVCSSPIYTFTAEEDATYTAKWDANTNTGYTVEYYLENAHKNGYDLEKTVNLTGTTDTTVTAERTSYAHFVFNAAISTVNGNLAGDGSLVLKVYYTRNTYIITTTAENNKAGNVTTGKTAPYGTEITITASTNAGYTWLGWYKDDTLVSNSKSYSFNITETATFTAKWSINTDTEYTVEYYLQNIENDNYTLQESVTLNGKTDTTAYATIKSFTHFVYNTSKSTVSGNIDGDGSRILKVYYTRSSYTVSSLSDSSKAGSVTVGGTFKYGKIATLTATTNPGYTFMGWYEGDKKVCSSEQFAFNVDHSTKYVAKWSANTNTPYRVEYYLENANDNGYVLFEEESFVGTTEMIANAEIKSFERFNYNASVSTTSGNICGDGSLVLKVYYKRHVYTLSNANTNCGSISVSGSYKYGSIDAFEVTAIADKLGYEFVGWYSDNVLLSTELTYTFTADKSVESRFTVRQEMANFVFTSTSTTCSITGIKNTTLTEIAIPDYITAINDGTFYSCSSLTNVYITDLTAWCNIKFANYSSNPLYRAKNLYLNGELVTDLVLPDSVTNIGSYAFAFYETLSSVTFNSTVTSIGESAFYSCDKLTDLIIESGVTSVGRYAFASCDNLKSVTISNGNATIDSYAFSNSWSLTTYYFNGTKEKWESFKISYPASYCTVYCLDGTIYH